ncbi:hypothetical protein ACYPKM_00605 [Pseudomonas aeruginosa]
MSNPNLQFDVVVCVEKMAVASDLHSYFSRKWQGKRLGIVAFGALSGLYRPAVPKVGQDRAPIQEVVWEHNPNTYPRVLHVDNGILHKVGESLDDVLDTLRQAGEIVCAVDPDHSGVIGFHSTLEQALGVEGANKEREFVHLAGGLDSAAIARALFPGEPFTTAGNIYQSLLKQGQAKRYFDFNYQNLAAKALEGAHSQVGIGADGPIVGKFSLQLLFMLSHESDGVDMHRYIRDWLRDSDNTGIRVFGAAAIPEAIKGLVSSKLIDDSAGLSHVTITDEGLQFLARVSGSCEDPLLPSRLRGWMKDWPSSKPQIDDYLCSFFGL